MGLDNVYLTTFATPDFKSYQKDLIASAKQFGIKKFFTFSSKQLKKTDFYKQNVNIFAHSRGFGYWLWKPYYILKALEEVKVGEIIFYADAGSLLIEEPDTLIDLCLGNESGIVAFDAWPLTNHQWCKRDAFVVMGCDSVEYWFSKHVIATTMLIRKSAFTVSFVKEWLAYCCHYNAITESANLCGPNKDGFIKHMGDQPIFSILLHKYKIETYRNPSKWGNFLKLAEFRVKNEFVGYPYMIDNLITTYSDKPYQNSPYGTVFIFNRKQSLNTQMTPSTKNGYILQTLASVAKKTKRKFFPVKQILNEKRFF